MDILKSADEVIKEEKTKGQKLRRNIIFLNIAVVILIAIGVIIQDFLLYMIHNPSLSLTLIYTTQEALLQLNAIVLTYSVVKIRRTIKASNQAFPNEGLVRVHVGNTIVFSIIWLLVAVLQFRSGANPND